MNGSADPTVEGNLVASANSNPNSSANGSIQRSWILRRRINQLNA